jgi:hypothetical protein
MLRLALISTPRSGNTWARALLESIYDLKPIPVHFPEEIDWDKLPGRCVIQIHWYPIEPFFGLLEKHGVRVVVLSRHPFDVLMSWLNYAYYVHQEGYCPGGGSCTECGIVGVLPRSEAFLEWARGEYGRCLLCYSPAWWNHAGVMRLRYEDLVAEPEATLARLTGQVGEPPRRSIAEAVEKHSIAQRKPSQDVWHFHYWQGQPGLWREFIPAAEARLIAASVPEPFDILGYRCDPDEGLEPARADQNWTRLQLESTREHLRLERSKHRKTVKDFKTVQEELERARQALESEKLALDELRRTLSSTEAQLEVAMRPNSGLRSIARRVKRIANRFQHSSRRA